MKKSDCEFGTSCFEALSEAEYIAENESGKKPTYSMDKKEFKRMVEKERKVSNRLYELLDKVAQTLSDEFSISYYDAEDEIVKWGRRKDEEDW